MFADLSAIDPAEILLVRQAASGNHAAFEKLYRQHVGRIYGLCLRMLGGDVPKAEAATQDAFVRAWEKLSGFRGEAPFGAWLHRLTTNLILGEYRLLRRWTVLDDWLDEGEGISEDPMPHVADRIDLDKALARLPPGARAVLWLHDVEGYKHEEIAEATGIAVGTSKAQLHRARKLMKEHLQ
jgi:RNA polymerase sigma-70 factor (ECF subfamily)